VKFTEMVGHDAKPINGI